MLTAGPAIAFAFNFILSFKVKHDIHVAVIVNIDNLLIFCLECSLGSGGVWFLGPKFMV